MTAEWPPQFAQALADARTCLSDTGKLSGVVIRASDTGEEHYDSLLGEWESLQTLLRLLRGHLSAKYRATDAMLLMALGALLYFLNPLDLIPDTIPVLGYVDDGAVITYVVRSNLREISCFRNWEFAFQRDAAESKRGKKEFPSG
jgi:uncharacterized membrane protein YkvA (DUF1232 family)